MSKEKVYFPNLNGIRFFAALLVIIHHIEQYKDIHELPSYWDKIPFIEIIGRLGVTLFFVLSGFLITYLLLSEEKVFGAISIKKFYVRRILRIWPLYFLIVILALFILPHIHIFTLPGYSKAVIYTHLFLKILFYVVFLPNLVFAKFGVIPYAAHTWSIGTEEQFYLVWPVLIKFFHKYRMAVMFTIIFGYLFIYGLLLSHVTDGLSHRDVILRFWQHFNIDCMAIGGIFAILLFRKDKLLKLFMNNYLFYFTLVFVFTLILLGKYVPTKTVAGFVIDINNETYAVLFGILILNFAVNNKIKISLENALFTYLGNISYGLYMYHPISIILAITIATAAHIHTNWFVYPLSIGLTILLAGLSYKYFESYFLRFKTKFSNIISGMDVKKKEV